VVPASAACPGAIIRRGDSGLDILKPAQKEADQAKVTQANGGRGIEAASRSITSATAHH
jgi:hypothetical protein